MELFQLRNNYLNKINNTGVELNRRLSFLNEMYNISGGNAEKLKSNYIQKINI